MTTGNVFQNNDDFVSFSKGQMVFEADEAGDVMYVVIEGKLQILVGDKVVETVGPEGIVGEMALIESEPRSATVLALTDCTLFPISQRRFTFLVQEKPYFALEVMRVMARRLRLMDMRI